MPKVKKKKNSATPNTNSWMYLSQTAVENIETCQNVSQDEPRTLTVTETIRPQSNMGVAICLSK